MNPSPAPTWRELLARLPADLTSPALDDALRAAQTRHTAATPWLLWLFAGVGAWFSAGFLQIFLVIFGTYGSPVSCFIVGCLLITGALILNNHSPNVFVKQLSLAALLAGNGHVLGCAGLLEGDTDRRFTDILAFMTLIQVLVAAIVAWRWQGAVGVFLTTLWAPAMAVFWLVLAKQGPQLHALIGLLTAGAVLLYAWPRRPRAWDPVALALLVALPLIILFLEFFHGMDFSFFREFYIAPWPASPVVGVGLLGALALHAGGTRALSRPWFWLAATAIAALAAFTTPGVLVAMLLLFIGRAACLRPVEVLGWLFLAGFLFLFYYAMNVSLAHKSWVITGSGVLLLLLRPLAGLCTSPLQPNQEVRP